jgi:hypothetical protein
MNDIENNLENSQIDKNNLQINENNFYYIISITLCLSYLIICCLLLLIIFSIIGLANTSNNDILCPNSHLWYYLLISLLILLITIINYKIKQNSNNYFYNIIFYVIISLGMIIWGTYELFYIDCINKLSDTILYKVSFTYWIYNISFCGINIGLFISLILFSIQFCNTFYK